MYRWNGVDRLTDCRVEQDYYSRRRQQKSSVAQPGGRPAHDPWAHAIETPDPAVEAATRAWLEAGGSRRCPRDHSTTRSAEADRIGLATPEIEILDCFAGETRAAFHLSATGTIAVWPGAADGLIGQRRPSITPASPTSATARWWAPG